MKLSRVSFFLEHAQNLVHIPVLVLKSKALFPLRLVVERQPLSRFSRQNDAGSRAKISFS